MLKGFPKDHKHLRVYMKSKDDTGPIFQEATIARILRACPTIRTSNSKGARA
jgi:hypothetical protein